MAIVFLDHSINGRVLNAFNNNVVRFTGDLQDTIVKAHVTVDDYVFQITPSPTGEFYFNFKTVVSKLINTSKFADSNLYNYIGLLWDDKDAYLDIIVTYQIFYSGGYGNPVDFTYKFVKGLHQVKEKEIYNNRGDSFTMLSTINNVSHLTFFKGYPFSIPLYGESISISITNVAGEAQFLAFDLASLIELSKQINYQNNRGAYRLNISDGEEIWEEISNEYNFITFNGYLIKLRAVDRCGVYLKWHNQYGGWDYYLFEHKHNLELDDKSLGSINTDFENLWDTETPDINVGKKVAETMQLWAFGVYHNEIERVKGLLHSPKVYLYTGERYAPNTADNWLPIIVNGKSLTRPSHNRRVTISIEVELPQTYTLAL